jgi:hypothetical protein
LSPFGFKGFGFTSHTSDDAGAATGAATGAAGVVLDVDPPPHIQEICHGFIFVRLFCGVKIDFHRLFQTFLPDYELQAGESREVKKESEVDIVS